MGWQFALIRLSSTGAGFFLHVYVCQTLIILDHSHGEYWGGKAVRSWYVLITPGWLVFRFFWCLFSFWGLCTAPAAQGVGISEPAAQCSLSSKLHGGGGGGVHKPCDDDNTDNIPTRLACWMLLCVYDPSCNSFLFVCVPQVLCVSLSELSVGGVIGHHVPADWSTCVAPGKGVCAQMESSTAC